MIIGKHSIHFMGVEIYMLTNDNLLNERTQRVEDLIMCRLKMNDMLSQLGKDQLIERNSIEIAIVIKL